MPTLLFIAQPNVVIDPAVPVPEWPLSPVDRTRTKRFASGKAGAMFRSLAMNHGWRVFEGDGIGSPVPIWCEA